MDPQFQAQNLASYSGQNNYLSGNTQGYSSYQTSTVGGGNLVSGGNVVGGNVVSGGNVLSSGQGVSYAQGGNYLSSQKVVGQNEELVRSSRTQQYVTGGAPQVYSTGGYTSGQVGGYTTSQVGGYSGSSQVVVGGGQTYLGDNLVRSSRQQVVGENVVKHKKHHGGNVVSGGNFVSGGTVVSGGNYYGDKVVRNTNVVGGDVVVRKSAGKSYRKSYNNDGYLRTGEVVYKSGNKKVEKHSKSPKYVENNYLSANFRGSEVRRSVRKSETSRRGEGKVVDTNYREGEERVVETRELDRRELEVVERESIVKSRVKGEAVKTSERTTDSHVVREYEVAGEPRELRPSVQKRMRDRVVDVNIEKPVFTERVVEVEVEVIKEKPVPIYKEVEVPYDVVVEKPIEKVIEKEVVREILMEIPYEKIVEIPYERVVEVPIEKIIEKPVYIEDVVEVPVERVVEDVKPFIIVLSKN